MKYMHLPMHKTLLGLTAAVPLSSACAVGLDYVRPAAEVPRRFKKIYAEEKLKDEIISEAM
jgi:hypothetical protein